MANSAVIDFLNSNVVHFVATIDNGEPRVRAMRVIKADDKGILYSAPAFKDLVKQIKATPKAETMAFDPEKGIQMRVHGDVEIIENQAYKDRIIQHFPQVKSAVDLYGYDGIFVFRIVKGTVSIWKRDEPQKGTKWETY